MSSSTATTDAVRAAKVFTFENHPPLRVPGAEGLNLWDATDGIVCDLNPQWGHSFLGYFVTRSGKRVYVSSYSSGECYGGRDAKVTRRVERNPMEWLCDQGKEHSHGHLIDPSLIIDLDKV